MKPSAPRKPESDGRPLVVEAVWTWKRPVAVLALSQAVALRASDVRAPWATDLSAASTIQVAGAKFHGHRAMAVSLPITPTKLKIVSYQFPPPGVWRDRALPAVGRVTPAASAGGVHAQSRRQPTRIKPPLDIIKLEDRLLYVLQPPLESLIGNSSLAFPSTPFPFQFAGVAFLYPRYAAVLADEMGLGKTMQAITALRLLLHAGEVSSVLLICPKPLVTNWQREFASWAPEVPVTAIEGEQTRRRWQWQQSETPVKIANYELLQRDRQLVAELGLKFDLVVLDEAQRIKNRASATSQAVRQIERRRSWALTGTPVENSPQDLVGIFEFLAPGYLSDTMKPRRMGRAASDYVLRRTKDKVLSELPPKMFREAEAELGPQQRASYQLAEEQGVLRLAEMGREATIQHVFELILRLKQICNFDPATGESSKLERLAADLDEVVASDRKAIIFSQWVSTLETLARGLAHLKPLEYHGRIAPRQRDAVLAQFRDDPGSHVLLLSYGVGGVGLNLQFAQYVFLFDRWWNPAVEDQAINRAHRIGVSSPVTVTRFLALETIEQRIDQILREKREIFDAIFDDVEPTHHSSGLTQQEIFGLFRLRSPSGPIDVAA